MTTRKKTVHKQVRWDYLRIINNPSLDALKAELRRLVKIAGSSDIIQDYPTKMSLNRQVRIMTLENAILDFNVRNWDIFLPSINIHFTKRTDEMCDAYVNRVFFCHIHTYNQAKFQSAMLRIRDMFHFEK